MAQYLVLDQKSLLGFPGDSMVKNPPASVGDMGSIPNSRRFYIPQSNQVQVSQLLSVHSKPLELQLWKPTCPRDFAPTREATEMRSPYTATREQPPLATAREKPTQQWRPSTAKNL